MPFSWISGWSNMLKDLKVKATLNSVVSMERLNLTLASSTDLTFSDRFVLGNKSFRCKDETFVAMTNLLMKALDSDIIERMDIL